MSNLKNRRGFTLIELMVVIVIVGILSGLALASFLKVTPKAKQSEARLILKQIYTNEMTRRQQCDGYFIPAASASAANPLAFKDILIEIAGNAKYTYSITGDSNTFVATATSGILDNDATIDTWTIDQTGNMVCVSDDAQN